MNVIDIAKNNPWKVLFGSASSIIAIVGALFTVDARYAHAADVEKDKTEIRKTIQQTISLLRRQNIEDEIFKLDLKRAQNSNQELSPVDKALRERYQRQLDQLMIGN